MAGFIGYNCAANHRHPLKLMYNFIGNLENTTLK